MSRAPEPPGAASTLYICSVRQRALRAPERLPKAERNSQKLTEIGCMCNVGVFVCVCGVLVYNIIITPPEIRGDQRRKRRINTMFG